MRIFYFNMTGKGSHLLLPFRKMSTEALLRATLHNGALLNDVAAGSRYAALYFSAGWCPDCVRFAPKLKKLAVAVPSLPIILVSSDRDASGLKKQLTTLRPAADIEAFGFDDPLRDDLKRRFGACAGSEQRSVGVAPRISGVPTLLLIKWPPVDGDKGQRISEKQMMNAAWQKSIAT